MRIEVRRSWYTSRSTVGELYLNGQFFCYTLEPPKRDVKPRAIPVGTYDLSLRFSERFSRLMPHVESVPGFGGILIHWGNYPKDTEGCLLVGSTHETDFVGNSRSSFDRLWAELQEAREQGPITISYTEQLQIAPDLTGEISV